ncbi:MAG: DUF1517 domain-containing protein [Thainema sp.]
MVKKIFSFIKPLLKPLVALGLVAVLFFSTADSALAARGGRVGGGSFRAPSRSAPSRTYRPPAGGGYGYPGGGFGFPFIFPLFGFGGGGLFSLLIMFAIASFLIRAFRQFTSGDGYDSGYGGTATNPKISVAKLQVGLLSEARGLQSDLERIAMSADTSSSEGLAQVLQETTLSLLRHPDYWMYAATDSEQARLESAEAKFNQMVLAERSKFSEEAISNVNNQLKQAETKAALPGEGGELAKQAPGEYIVATVVVGVEGDLSLPKVTNSQDLRRAISQIGSVSSDRLLALEVLWSPQGEGDTLTSDDLMAQYPNLALV